MFKHQLRLVCLHGPTRKQNAWLLTPGKKLQLGRRMSNQRFPEIDLWPDLKISRKHADLWFEKGSWWIEDRRSTYGTLVDGSEVRGKGPVCVKPSSEIQIGQTLLLLVLSESSLLWTSDLFIELQMMPTLNFALVHSGIPMMSRLVVRNIGTTPSKPIQIAIAISDFVRAKMEDVPSLAPDACHVVPTLTLQVNTQEFERLTEKKQQQLAITLNRPPLASRHGFCWLLAHNEWSLSSEYAHRLSLAAFVQPNHPLVSYVAQEALPRVEVPLSSEEIVRSLYHFFSENWTFQYLREPPNWDSNSQKVRLAHHVLQDIVQRRGHGNCLDLALLVASCLEYLQIRPLLALVHMGKWLHALVGWWHQNRRSMESLLMDKNWLLTDTGWIDPTGWTRDKPMEFTIASRQAVTLLQSKPFLFALDVATARTVDGILPLPFSGEPQWSAPTKMALKKAMAYAKKRGVPLGTVPLLIGLLSIPNGITHQVMADHGQSEKAVLRQLNGLSLKPGPSDLTQHYRDILNLAKGRAKDSGSPLILEDHLLRALLDVMSQTLDSALTWIGMSRERLKDSLGIPWQSHTSRVIVSEVFSSLEKEPTS